MRWLQWIFLSAGSESLFSWTAKFVPVYFKVKSSASKFLPFLGINLGITTIFLKHLEKHQYLTLMLAEYLQTVFFCQQFGFTSQNNMF